LERKKLYKFEIGRPDNKNSKMKDLEAQIESALSREPKFNLPSDFADRLVAKIETAKRIERRVEILLIGVSALLFFAGLIVVIALTDFKISLSAFSFLSNNIWFICFAIVFVGLLNFLDRKLVRKGAINL
jgi:hypothetical protein